MYYGPRGNWARHRLAPGACQISREGPRLCFWDVAAVGGRARWPDRTVTNIASYRLRFRRTANRVLAIWGEREVYDSALGFLSFVFRIHGVQPDAPTGSQFQRPVAGRGANQTERRGPKEAPGWRPTIDPGGETWVAGPKAEGLVGRNGGSPSTSAHAKVHSSGPEGHRDQSFPHEQTGYEILGRLRNRHRGVHRHRSVVGETASQLVESGFGQQVGVARRLRVLLDPDQRRVLFHRNRHARGTVARNRPAGIRNFDRQHPCCGSSQTGGRPRAAARKRR